MTIKWGPWEYSGGNGMRIGLDSDNTNVTHSSDSVTYTFHVYTQNQYLYDDDQTINWGGALSGTTGYHNGSSGGVVSRGTKSFTYTYPSTSYGASPGVITASASVSGAYNGVTPSVTLVQDIPGRPYAAPASPSSVGAVRNSDAQATVTWTRHATTGEPYSSQTVAMRTYSAPNVWSVWAIVATVSATATSYVKTGLSANHVYQFEVRSNNSVASSAYVSSPSVYMSPAAPSAVRSSLNPNGTSVTTTWTNNHYSYTGTTLSIERSVAGGAYAVLATGLAYNTTSYNDVSPAAGTNVYRVRATVSDGVLRSAYAVGNAVSTVVPPAAPTLLSPNGVPLDLWNEGVLLTWQHNPGGDNAAQSHFTIERSVDGGATWSSIVTDQASTVRSYQVPAGVLANGITYKWRVRTEGIVSAGYGPNSAAATVTGSSRPITTLTSPGITITELPISVAWIYNQDETSPQTAWEVRLYENDGATVLEQQQGSDATSLVTLTAPVLDDTGYVVAVRARSAAGLWSAWTSQAILVELLPPAAVDATLEYHPETGTTTLALSPQADVPGTTVPVQYITVQRRVPDGEWVQLFTDLTVPTEVLDPLPALVGTTEYLITSVSASPSYYENPIVSVTPADPLRSGPQQWVFVNYGDGFGWVLRFRGQPSLKESSGRTKAVQSFAGRKKPLLLLGTATTRVISADGTLVYDVPLMPEGYDADSPPADWHAAAMDAELVCFRDFTGRRVFGSLGDVDTEDTTPGVATVSFVVTETDYVERYG